MIVKKKKCLRILMLTPFFLILYYYISLNSNSKIIPRFKTVCNAILPRKQQSILIDGIRNAKHVPWHHNNVPIISRSKTGCNAILPRMQPSILIDGIRYPKHVPWHHNNSINFSCLNENRVIGKKRILLWTTFHGSPLQNDLESLIFTKKSSEVFDLLRCPVNNCELTLHKSKLNQSSLVLFHLRNLIHRWPEYRAPDQRWVIILYIFNSLEKDFF